MLAAADFIAERIQFAAFFSERIAPRDALAFALTDLAAVYDGEPLSFPLPEGSPPDFPAVLLSSRDEHAQLEISNNRASASRTRLAAAPIDLASSLQETARELAALSARIQASISRVGVVAVRRINAEHPGRALATQFCRDEWLAGPLNRPEGFEIHAHKIFLLTGDIRVNSWIRIRSVQTRPAGPFDAITVEQDINSLWQEIVNRHLDGGALREFAQAAARELDTILALYFPNSERAG